MKRILLSIVFVMAIATMVWGQNPNAEAIKNSIPYCPGLFNPKNFSISGQVNLSNASWTGYTGGDNNPSGQGKKGQDVSKCGDWDMDCTTKIPANILDRATINSTASPDKYVYYSSSCSGSQSAEMQQRRFKIMSAANDPMTSNNLRTVPTDPDTIFAKSIRLGNQCGGGKQAERLTYQFKVMPQNCLLVIYYALSLENAAHDAANNPEFLIEIQVGTPTASTRPSDLNTYSYDTLGKTYFYAQPTPESGRDIAPFLNGGRTGGAGNVYLPWNKVVINLGQHLYKPVRIQIVTGDCAYSVHYAYSYIAGYCRPMVPAVNGCPVGTGDIVSTLTAPAGLEDPSYTTDQSYHAYKWYRSTNANIVGDQVSMTQANNDEWFASNFEQIPNQFNHTYETHANEFMMNGQLVEKRAYACEMTTYMNRETNSGGIRKYPIKSRIFFDASNIKPQIAIIQNPRCDGSIQLTDVSTCGPGREFLKTNEIKWDIYDNENQTGEPISRLTGEHVTFQSNTAGTYYAKMLIPTDSAGCFGEGTVRIKSIESPKAIPVISNEEPCIGDEVELRDNSTNTTNRKWEFSDGSSSTETTLSKSFTLPNDTVRLIVTNEYSETTGNASQTRPCADTTIKVIHVFTSPNLIVSDDTIVCEGQLTNVTVNVNDNDPAASYKYEWFRHLDRPNETRIQEGNILQQIPDENAPTCTYYVKVTRMPQGCIAWDSVTVHVVRPTLKMIPADGKICPGESAKLIAGNAHHYSWSASPADPTLVGQETATTITVKPTQTTTYTLIGHGSDDCNADPLTKTVKIFPTPIPRIEITPNFVDSEEPIVTFNDASQFGASTKWNFGNGKTSTERTVSHTFDNISLSEFVTVGMTTYNALGNKAPGCYADTTIDIPIQLFSVWIPNAFTPTLADNKTFSIVTANILEYFSIRIFNRQGQQVFYSTDQNFKWDGTYKGTVCPQGAYIYMIKYRRPGTSEITEREGTLTLLR